ncbi:MAG: hypothetical protein JW861_01475 [Bacteroidales bacterium]|nr:hypothetical protein [Bacteroidales bacterium]
MKYIISLLLIMILAGCHRQDNASGVDQVNPLAGDWAFLDKSGTYIEACFHDSTYLTYNRVQGMMPEYRYRLAGDSLQSDIDRRRNGLYPIAKVEWLGDGKVILITEFTRDTLERIPHPDIVLSNTDPVRDSLRFAGAFNVRYENFLIAKGILTSGEIEAWKSRGEMPDDVREQMEQQQNAPR